MCTYNYAKYIQNALTCEPFEKDLEPNEIFNDRHITLVDRNLV